MSLAFTPQVCGPRCSRTERSVGLGVRPLPDGAYGVQLEHEERQLLRGLAAELEQLVRSEDAGVARLFPPAYRDDPAAEDEYRRLVRGTLASGRLDALRVLQTGVASERITQEEADVWCSALNDLRLVLGERLGVTQDLYEKGLDLDDPQVVELSIYGWLTWLQGTVIDALAANLLRKVQESAEADS